MERDIHNVKEIRQEQKVVTVYKAKGTGQLASEMFQMIDARMKHP